MVTGTTNLDLPDTFHRIVKMLMLLGGLPEGRRGLMIWYLGLSVYLSACTLVSKPKKTYTSDLYILWDLPDLDPPFHLRFHLSSLWMLTNKH